MIQFPFLFFIFLDAGSCEAANNGQSFLEMEVILMGSLQVLPEVNIGMVLKGNILYRFLRVLLTKACYCTQFYSKLVPCPK